MRCDTGATANQFDRRALVESVSQPICRRNAAAKRPDIDPPMMMARWRRAKEKGVGIGWIGKEQFANIIQHPVAQAVGRREGTLKVRRGRLPALRVRNVAVVDGKKKDRIKARIVMAARSHAVLRPG